jgi:hypothetical protein
MMKKLYKFSWALAIVALLGSGGCSDDDDSASAVVTLSAESTVFSVDGGSKQFSVATTTEEAQLSALSDSDWCVASISDKTLTITTEANTTTEVRRAVVTVKSSDGAADATINVAQEADIETELSLSATTLEFDSEGGDGVVAVKSNRTWSATTESDWFTINADPATGKLVVSVATNEGDVAKEGTVTIVSGTGEQAKSESVAVRQDIRANNPYLRLVGEWDFYADIWYQAMYSTQAYCTYNFSTNEEGTELVPTIFPGSEYLTTQIIAQEYNDRYTLKNFFLGNTSLSILYHKENNTIEIPLGWLVGITTSYTYGYLVQVHITEPESSFNFPNYLTGQDAGSLIGTVSEDGNTITLSGFEQSFGSRYGFGIKTYDDDEGAFYTFQYAYYAFGPTVELRRHVEEPQVEASAAHQVQQLQSTKELRRIDDSGKIVVVK